ncbi:MAG: nitroreductase family protein [Pseudomonadota bacterium]
MTSKHAVTREPIAPLLGERWSPRAFDADKAVSVRQLTQLMEAARWAPSCYNEQPWRYVVCDRNQNDADWEKALSCLVEGNRSWAARAPILMAAIANTQFTRNGKHNRWSEYDTGAASENLCLQATVMGLAAHQMGGFDPQAVIDTFHLPEHCTPVAMIAVGYPGDPAVLAESGRAAETKERERRSVNEFAFLGDWNKPLLD